MATEAGSTSVPPPWSELTVATATVASGVTTERALVTNRVLKEAILGNAVSSVGSNLATFLVGIGVLCVASAVESSAAVTSVGALIALFGGAVVGVAAIVVGVFWMGWMTYVKAWKDYFTEMSKITVWTDYDTMCLARRIQGEKDAKLVICEQMMLDTESFIGEFPNDPIQRAINAAGLALVARIHKIWPLKKGVSKKSVVEWMKDRYQKQDIVDYAELTHAFAEPINAIRNLTKKMEPIIEQIQKLEMTERSALIFPDMDIPRVVLIGKTGSGKSTLANRLVDGRFVDYSVSSEDDESEEEKREPAVPHFGIGDGGLACSTEVKAVLSESGFPCYIIDTPGLSDTGGKDGVLQQKVVTALQSIEQVSCFILCLNMSERATEEVRERVIGFLETQYGSEVWDHTILVLTHCYGKSKPKKKEGKLIQEYWVPLGVKGRLPAKVISMENEEESEFGKRKLEQLFGMIAEMHKKPMKSDKFETELTRQRKKLKSLESKLTDWKIKFKDLAEKDVYVTKSIERKQSVMRGRDEYKSVDLEERVSQCPDLAGLPDTNPLMEQVLKSLKQQTERELEAIHAAVEEVSLIMLEVEKD